MSHLTHVNENGQAHMVDVSHKKVVKRTAIAEGRIMLAKETIQLVKENQLKKGDVIAVARIAAILGGKKTSDLIPLCHNIQIDQIDVRFEIEEDGIFVQACAICTDKTGIEMEALNSVSIACLTIYDMCKAVDKNMRITDIHLVKKTKEEL